MCILTPCDPYPFKGKIPTDSSRSSVDFSKIHMSFFLKKIHQDTYNVSSGSPSVLGDDKTILQIWFISQVSQCSVFHFVRNNSCAKEWGLELKIFYLWSEQKYVHVFTSCKCKWKWVSGAPQVCQSRVKASAYTFLAGCTCLTYIYTLQIIEFSKESGWGGVC